MEYVGIDFHKRSSFITHMDQKGKIIKREKISNHIDSLKGYVDSLKAKSRVVLEATCNWYYFYELVEAKGIEVSLAHPLKTKAIASSRIKTDKIDAETLAHLLRSDLVPTAYIPKRETRDAREILRYRASLVGLRTMIKNKVHAILSKNGLFPGYADIFGKKGTAYLKSLKLRTCYRQAIDGYLRQVEKLNHSIEEVSERIKSMATEDPRAEILMSMPGVSYYSALLILSEIGDIKRFPSPGQLCSYGGLVPSVHASGDRVSIGHITKQGSKWLRWILIQVCPHAVRGSRRFWLLYHRVERRHGVGAAKVAVAREMLKCIYHMLSKNEVFRDFPTAERINRAGHLQGVMTRKRS